MTTPQAHQRPHESSVSGEALGVSKLVAAPPLCQDFCHCLLGLCTPVSRNSSTSGTLSVVCCARGAFEIGDCHQIGVVARQQRIQAICCQPPLISLHFTSNFASFGGIVWTTHSALVYETSTIRINKFRSTTSYIFQYLLLRSMLSPPKK